jgi:uncharacterized membrane protein
VERGAALAVEQQGGRMPLWMIPMSYALASVVAAFTLPRIEDAMLPAFRATISVASAQSFLSTVASGMMALTGIVFSIAFVMVQFSAVAYSPRLVQWLGRDGVLFHAMGMFIATFTYSLATLIWIDRQSSGQVLFFSMWLVGLLLIASMILFALLVQRITSLSITNVLHFIGARGRAVIRETFPRGADAAAVVDAAEEARGDLGEVTQTLHYKGKPRSVARFDIQALVRQASQADTVIVLTCAVGDTVVEDSVILRVHGARTAMAERPLLNSVHLSDERTFEQDPKYPLRLLADIAIKALSPAINDPTTAVQALDQIEDLLRRMAKCRLDAGYARDAGGRLRLVFPMPTWVDYLALSFDEIRFYGADSVQVMRRLRSALTGLLDSVNSPPRAAAVRSYLGHLDRMVDASRMDPDDKAMARREDRQGLGLSRGTADGAAGPAVLQGNRVNEARPGALPLDPARGREAPGPHSV